MDANSTPSWIRTSGGLLFVVIAASVSGCMTASDLKQDRGREVVEARCQSCHATGVNGQSTAPEAPPFRELSARGYRVANLEAALRTGMSQGHPPMPEVKLSPEDVDSVLAYFEALQED